MSCYMPYDFKDEVIEAMAETMLDNDKVSPELRKRIQLYVQAKKLEDQMDALMEDMHEPQKSPSPADTATPYVAANDTDAGTEDDGEDA